MLADFVDWFKAFCASFWVTVHNGFIDSVQIAFDALITLALSVVGMFPAATPMPAVPAAPTGSVFDIFIMCLNWIFPIQFIVTVTLVVVAAVVAFFAVSPIARFFKLIN